MEDDRTQPKEPHYGYYQIHQHPVNNIEERKERPSKKKKGTGKNFFCSRFVPTVALAVVFGLVSGVVFQGVNRVADLLLPDKETAQTDAGNEAAVDDMVQQITSVSDMSAQTGTVAGVAEATMPSVVAITSVSVQQIMSFWGSRQYESASSGSGIIVGENEEELLIATNNHVVEGATALSVCFIGDDVEPSEKYTGYMTEGDINLEDAVAAKIKGMDEDNDLAVISVLKSDIPEDTMNMIKIAEIGDSDSLSVGDQVVAIGNALGYGQSVTSGWISALNRRIQMEDGSIAEMIQTDAAINSGNSGGALLNMNGELIGINSAKNAESGVEGMGYAIPITKAQPILENLMNRKTREMVSEEDASALGVHLTDVTASLRQMYGMPEGAFVVEVYPGTAAEDYGIRKGDIIINMDGQTITGKEELADQMRYYAADETVEIVISRFGEGGFYEKALQVTLDAKNRN